MSELLRDELATQWQKYFKTKGGGGPGVAGEILPVVIVDESLPYRPCRLFHALGTGTAVAAQFSSVVLINQDPLITRSAVVIDRIYCDRAQPLVILTVASLAAPYVFPAFAGVPDAAPEKELGTVLPIVGQVGVGGNAAAGLFTTGGAQYNVPLNTPIEGPWILGPTQAMVVQYQTANAVLTVTFRGRYYSGI